MRTRSLPAFIFAVLSVLHGLSTITFAHEHHGPPVRIMNNEPAGPWTVSVWAQSHMDTRTFFIQVHPRPGTQIPDDLQVKIGIQVPALHVPETLYSAQRDIPEAQYKTDAISNTAGPVHLRVVLLTPQGINELVTDLDGPASESGSAWWRFMLYSFPFLSLGTLWIRVYWLRRNFRRKVALAT